MAEDGLETQVMCDFCKTPRIQVGELTCRHRMCADCFPFYSNKLDKCYICVLAAAELKRAAMKIVKGSADAKDIPFAKEEKFFCPNADCSFVGTLPILFSHKIACNMKRAVRGTREKMSDVLAFFGERHALKTSLFVEIMKDLMESALRNGRDTFSAKHIQALTLEAWKLADETLCNEGVESDQQQIDRDEEQHRYEFTIEGCGSADHLAEFLDLKNVGVSQKTDAVNNRVGSSGIADEKHCKTGANDNQQQIDRDEEQHHYEFTIEGCGCADLWAEVFDSKNVGVSQETDATNYRVGSSGIAVEKHCKTEADDDWMTSEGSPANSDSSSLASEEIPEQEPDDEAVLNFVTLSHGDPNSKGSSSNEFEENREELFETNGPARTPTTPSSNQPRARDNSYRRVRIERPPVKLSDVVGFLGILCALLLSWYRLHSTSDERLRHGALDSDEMSRHIDNVSELVAESQFKNHAIRFSGSFGKLIYETRIGLGVTRQNGTNVLWIVASIVKKNKQRWPEYQQVELRLQHKDSRLTKNCTFVLGQCGIQEYWKTDHRGVEKLRHMEQQRTKHLSWLRFTDFLTYEEAVNEGYINEDRVELGLKFSWYLEKFVNPGMQILAP